MSMPMVVLKSDFRQNTTYVLLPGQRRHISCSEPRRMADTEGKCKIVRMA